MPSLRKMWRYAASNNFVKKTRTSQFAFSSFFLLLCFKTVLSKMQVMWDKIQYGRFVASFGVEVFLRDLNRHATYENNQ